MNWDQVKKILALIVAYFKDVFEFFYKKDDVAADETTGE